MDNFDLDDILRPGTLAAAYGPAGAGVTTFVADQAAQLLRRDPEALAVIFDTEYCPERLSRRLGDVQDRVVVADLNDGGAILRYLDAVGGDIERGAPVRLVAVDTLNGLHYPDRPDAPLGERVGLVYALSRFARRHNVAVLVGCHVRADFARGGLRPMPGAVEHAADCKVRIERGAVVAVERPVTLTVTKTAPEQVAAVQVAQTVASTPAPQPGYYANGVLVAAPRIFNVGDRVEACRNGVWKAGEVRTRLNETLYTVHMDGDHQALEAYFHVTDLRAPQAPPKPQRVLHDACPKCGDAGEWRACALVCRKGHGVFAG